MTVTTWIVGTLLAVAFMGAGSAKIVGAKQAIEDLDLHFGMSPMQRRLIGLAEVSASAGILASIWIPTLGIAAGVGLVGLMIGAVTFHLRAGDPPFAAIPAAVLGGGAAAYLILLALP